MNYSLLRLFVGFLQFLRSPVTLTALAVLGLLDNKRNLTATYRNSMNKGIDYVALQWSGLATPYQLSLAAYMLHKAVHPARDQAWDKLSALSQEEGGQRWWASEVPELEKDNPWHARPNTINIETTAYALLCLTDREEISAAVPVSNWLFSQQNSNGGFASTSDTYTALLALTEYGKGFEVQNRNTDMSIQYEFLGTVRRIKVTTREYCVLCCTELAR